LRKWEATWNRKTKNFQTMAIDIGVSTGGKKGNPLGGKRGKKQKPISGREKKGKTLTQHRLVGSPNKKIDQKKGRQVK